MLLLVIHFYGLYFIKGSSRFRMSFRCDMFTMEGMGKCWLTYQVLPDSSEENVIGFCLNSKTPFYSGQPSCPLAHWVLALFHYFRFLRWCIFFSYRGSIHARDGIWVHVPKIFDLKFMRHGMFT